MVTRNFQKCDETCGMAGEIIVSWEEEKAGEHGPQSQPSGRLGTRAPVSRSPLPPLPLYRRPQLLSPGATRNTRTAFRRALHARRNWSVYSFAGQSPGQPSPASCPAAPGCSPEDPHWKQLHYSPACVQPACSTVTGHQHPTSRTDALRATTQTAACTASPAPAAHPSFLPV